jgi:hypothetical protein
MRPAGRDHHTRLRIADCTSGRLDQSTLNRDTSGPATMAIRSASMNHRESFEVDRRTQAVGKPADEIS